MNLKNFVEKTNLYILGLTSIMAIIMSINSFIQTTIYIKSQQRYVQPVNMVNSVTDTYPLFDSTVDCGNTVFFDEPVKVMSLTTEEEKVNTEPAIIYMVNTALSAEDRIAPPATYQYDNDVKVEIKIPKEYQNYDLSAKPYMDYRTITNESSNQWKLLHSDAVEVDDKGFIIDKDGYIGIALGSYFGKVGDRFEITLDTGTVLKVIKVEEKADVHTDERNFMGMAANEVIEFVIDGQTEFMKSNTKENGYIFSGNFNNYEELSGSVIKIEKVLTFEQFLAQEG